MYTQVSVLLLAIDSHIVANLKTKLGTKPTMNHCRRLLRQERFIPTCLLNDAFTPNPYSRASTFQETLEASLIV